MTNRKQKDETFPCPSCAIPVRYTDTFCESCGLKLEKHTCPACKTEAVPGSRYCESCGSPLHTSVTPEPPLPPAYKIPQRTDKEAAPAAPIKTETAQPGQLADGPEASLSIKLVYIAVAAVLVVLVLHAILVFTGSLPAFSPLGIGSPTGSNDDDVGDAFSIEPTQTLPAGTELNIQIDKNAIDGMVTVTLAGGQGKHVVKDIEVRLTCSDGHVKIGHISPGETLFEVSLSGTKGTDRIEVFVTQYSGQHYRVIDRLIALKTLG
ncbi:MAG: Double zinc ribbon [Methanoregula sp. PtaU1.Bin051]|nr:MAG: Double zinc ribbon [Methanoregula sp. PtaU1.Bin051]